MSCDCEKSKKWDNINELTQTTTDAMRDAIRRGDADRAAAAKWKELCAIVGDDPANAGRWMQDARRWRTVERAVERGSRFIAFQDKLGAVARCGEAGILAPYSSGPTLAAAVDALQERMDKEATPEPIIEHKGDCPRYADRSAQCGCGAVQRQAWRAR